MNEQNFSSTDAKFLCKYQVMSFFHHTYCLQNLKITLNWCGEQNSQLSSTKFGDKKLEQFFCMELFSELIYHVSKSNGNVFFGVIWCETHCNTGKVSWTSEIWIKRYEKVLHRQTHTDRLLQTGYFIVTDENFVGDKKYPKRSFSYFSTRSLPTNRRMDGQSLL